MKTIFKIKAIIMFAFIAFMSVGMAAMGLIKLDAGDFSASVLGATVEKMDKMWADNMVRPEFEAAVDAAKAVLGEQTAKVSVLEDPEEDRDMKVIWLKPDSKTPVDSTNDCVIGGDELESTSKTYALSYHKTVGFSVKEKADRTNILKMPEKIAQGFLMRMKDMDEMITATLISKIESFKGVNSFAGSKGTIVGTETYVAPEYWTADLFAYLLMTAKMNRLNNPYLLSGSNLWEADLNLAIAQANADGKGDAAKMKLIRKYFDLWNIDTLNDPALKTYMINKGVIAGAFKAHYKNKQVEYVHGADQKRFAIESKNLPGVYYDVFYNNACSNEDITHNWSFHARFDWLLNPTHVATKTGVLSFINGNAPA